MNLATIIDRHPADSVALISRRRETTYGELREQVASYRGGLLDRGLRPGDRIGLACGNNWYFVVSYLAALSAGLVAVPLNPLAPTPELEEALRVVGARALVVTPGSREFAASLDRSKLPELELLIVSEGVDLEGAVVIEDLLTCEPVDVVDRADDDLAALLFTSGTVGSPRAAMLTHGNLRSNLDQLQGHLGRRQDEKDVVFGVLPLFHIFGLNVLLGLSLHAGARIVLIERFDPASGIEAIKRHGITVIGGAPPMWAAWAALPGIAHDAFSTVRLAASGAAKLPIEVAQAIQDRFDLHLTEGYGLTECSPVVSTAGGTKAPFGSIGTPLPGVDVRLVDDRGDDVLTGDPGELLVRGANVFTGYWGDREATEQVLVDGWLHTGDVAVTDDDGYLYLVDRKKDLIIVSGFNVYPAEVEHILAEHPAVEQVAVIGVDHPYTGEAVKALIQLRDGIAAEEDEIIAWCSRHLARYKCPDKILFVDELPMGAVGKVIRRELREA